MWRHMVPFVSRLGVDICARASADNTSKLVVGHRLARPESEKYVDEQPEPQQNCVGLSRRPLVAYPVQFFPREDLQMIHLPHKLANHISTQACKCAADATVELVGFANNPKRIIHL